MKSPWRRVALALPLAAAVQTPLFEAVESGPLVDERGISRGAAWGDFDADGDADLFVTRPTWDGRAQDNRLYRNEGGGRFTRVVGSFGPPGAWEGALWVDVDNDGDLDLHVVGRNGAGSILFENDGASRLSIHTTEVFASAVSSASMACWADVDGDGRLDVFFVGYGTGRNMLFRNHGAWRFELIPISARAAGDGSGRACGWGDLNGDRLPELVVANALRPNTLLRNRGGMSLEVDTTTALQQDTAYGYGLSFTDVNDDGVRDLFIANFDADNSLYLGRLGGGLEPVRLGDRLQSAATKGHVWADFDLDGHIDAYLGSGTPGPGMLNRLYVGAGEDRFRMVNEGVIGAHADTSAAVAGADFDLDGDVDLFVANWGGAGSTNRLYRNTASGNWLRVALEGMRSNPMGVGARVGVLVTTHDGSRWLYRWLDLPTGYAGQNEPVLHFGLGDAKAVDSLVVDWPSGATDRFGHVPGGATVGVPEGARTIQRRERPAP